MNLANIPSIRRWPTGEILSSLIISNVIENCQLIDARKFIKTDSNFGFASVDFAKTDSLISKSLDTLKKHIIVPGFIASDSERRNHHSGKRWF